VEEALRARLLANTAIAAIVGTKVTWGDRPQNKDLPALVLLLVVPGRDYTHQGADGLTGARVQIEAYGKSAIQSAQLQGLVTAEMEDPKTLGSVRFDMCFQQGGPDGGVVDLEGGGKAYQRLSDWLVFYEVV
jgi:hypothetical protein